MLFLFVQAVTTSIYEDAGAGWNNHLFSGSLTEKRIVFIKYLEFLGLWLTGLLFNLLFAVIYGGVFGFSNIKSGYINFLLIAFLIAICQCIMIPLAYLYKNENAVVGRTFIAFLLPGYLIAGILGVSGLVDPADIRDSGFPNWCKAHMMLIAVSAVLIMLLAVLISYSVSLKIVQRREALCGACC